MTIDLQSPPAPEAAPPPPPASNSPVPTPTPAAPKQGITISGRALAIVTVVAVGLGGAALIGRQSAPKVGSTGSKACTSALQTAYRLSVLNQKFLDAEPGSAAEDNALTNREDQLKRLDDLLPACSPDFPSVGTGSAL